MLVKIFCSDKIHEEELNDNLFRFYLNSNDQGNYVLMIGNGKIIQHEDKIKVLNFFESIQNKQIQKIEILNGENILFDNTELNFSILNADFCILYNVDDPVFPGSKFEQIKITFNLYRNKEE